MKIILLEDDKTLHSSIREALELHHYECISFYDGKSFYEGFQNCLDGLFIFDVNVPHINGLELLEMLHTFNPSLKVIIISADSTLSTIEQAYTKGCIDYLKKPFYIKELLFKIKQYTPALPPLKPNQTLTKKEKLLLELLMQNSSTYVSYEQIGLYVYSQENMSMDALRSLVRRLKAKLLHATISNIAQIGYKIKM